MLRKSGFLAVEDGVSTPLRRPVRERGERIQMGAKPEKTGDSRLEKTNAAVIYEFDLPHRFSDENICRFATAVARFKGLLAFIIAEPTRSRMGL